MAKACLSCKAYDELDKVQCPVFVIGGMQDKVVGGDASLEIAKNSVVKSLCMMIWVMLPMKKLRISTKGFIIFTA